MKTHIPTALKTLRLPLGVAISSCLLVACSSPRTYQPIQTATPSAPVSAPAQPPSAWSNTTQSLPPTTQPTVQPPFSTNNPYQNNVYQAPPQVPYQGNQDQPAESAGLLDEEDLAFLEDFLEARDMSMVEGDLIAVQRYGDLWNRVRFGFKMPYVENSRIAAQKRWFYDRQAYIERLVARASRYLHYTVSEAERRGLPTELALLPIIESSYDPSATSNAQAAGLWQFIPSTGRIYGLNQSESYDGRRDVIESTRAAYDFLTSLYNRFGSWELALAAYNAGPGRIQRAIEANQARGLPTDYWSLRLPAETMNYVPRFMAVAHIINSPREHGIMLPAIANHPHFRAVDANVGVSLHEVSQVTGVPVSELQLLNPALTDLRVNASGPGRVVIPDGLANSVDNSIRGLAGFGYKASTNQTVSHVVPKTNPALDDRTATIIAKTAEDSTKVLQSTNTLPTTVARVTPHNTVTQEPPLSDEERAFIAEQIRIHSKESDEAISKIDGKIELDKIQTAQSVLDARQQPKTVRFDSNDTLAGRGQVSGAQSIAPNRSSVTDNATTYVVKRGDTLDGISKRYGVTIPQLREWNQMGVNTVLLAGSRLKIVAPTNVAPKPATKPTTTRSEVYVVRAGDTLGSIAEKHGLKVSQLSNYNNISVNAVIVPGQKLWLVEGKTSTSSAVARDTQTMTSYKVRSGDSLNSVANRFGTTKEAIARANNMKPTDGLIAGTTIAIPTTKGAEKTAPARTAKATTYTVKSGDTLTSVANQHKVSIADLAAANKLKETAGLTIGQKLTIPAAGTRQSATSNTKETSQPDQTSGKAISKTESYQVKSGETLTSIANRYGVSVADLAKTNNLSSNARLTVGQTIKVPKLTTTHKVKSGETLNGLAKRYGISASELAKMNGLKPNDGLRVGQTLTVPNK